MMMRGGGSAVQASSHSATSNIAASDNHTLPRQTRPTASGTLGRLTLQVRVAPPYALGTLLSLGHLRHAP